MHSTTTEAKRFRTSLEKSGETSTHQVSSNDGVRSFDVVEPIRGHVYEDYQCGVCRYRFSYRAPVPSLPPLGSVPMPSFSLPLSFGGASAGDATCVRHRRAAATRGKTDSTAPTSITFDKARIVPASTMLPFLAHAQDSVSLGG